MVRRSLSIQGRGRVLAALATLGAAGACNYDFDEFSGLGPPLVDSGAPTAGGAAGATRSDAGGAGKAGSSGGAAPDARVTTGAGGAGATGGASGGSAGSSGAAGSGGAAGTGAQGGAGGTAGSSGSGGAGAGGGAAGSSGTSGAGGTAGTGGSTVDASLDGAGGTGAGGTGTGGTGTGTGGTAGTATGGTAGAGTGGTSAGGAAGMGGAGAGGAGTGGTDGGTPPPDGGTRPDLQVVDISLDRVVPPFDCASVGGRIYENHCYWAVTTPVTWEVGSQKSCPAPAHLATITSAGEDSFVVSFLTDESRWVGLHRPAGSPQNTSAFVWVTGETSTYSHWYTANGEPDYDGECVRLGPSNNWGDNPCSAAFPVVCERE